MTMTIQQKAVLGVAAGTGAMMLAVATVAAWTKLRDHDRKFIRHENQLAYLQNEQEDAEAERRRIHRRIDLLRDRVEMFVDEFADLEPSTSEPEVTS